jgi:hypothetical protein
MKNRLAWTLPVVLLATAGPLVPSAAASSPAAAPLAITEAPTEAAALAAAKASGRRVEIAPARTERTQLFAEPSGRLTFESAAVAQRVKRSNGSWANIDPALQRGADGWRPVATAADVRFSNGGNGPAVTLVREGKTMTMSWPGGLATPTVTGDSASYPDALPGVDLVLRATRTGFTHVLVVKNAAAAANPALREIRFDIGGDAKVEAMPNGSLRAVAGKTLIASSSPAMMWDSADEEVISEGTARGGPEVRAFSGTRSNAVEAGDVARRAKVATRLNAAGHLLLTPDAGLIGRNAKFPVYVDPPWDSGPDPRWAYANKNNTNNEYSVARVGYSPGDGNTYRSFFEFGLSPMHDKYIHEAHVSIELTHSSSCSDQPTYLFHSGGISGTPRTAWSTSLGTLLASANSHANEGNPPPPCSGANPQPNQTPQFIDSRITGKIQEGATGHWPNITMGFNGASAAGGAAENNADSWKKFLPATARLIVEYDSIPGKPNSMQVGGVACGGTRVQIGTLNPALSAVYPDDDGGQMLAGTYEWLEIPASGTYDDSTPRKTAPPIASATAGNRGTTTTLSGVVVGKAYAFRVKTKDPAPYLKESPWSDWCEFAPNTAVPTAPTWGTPQTLPSGPGQEGTFTFVTNQTDVVTFRYGWSSTPTTEVAAAIAGSTRTATVKVTAPKFGENILWVYAINSVGTPGNYASKTFTVDRPAPPVASYGLEVHPASPTQATAFEDRQPALVGDSDLTNVANVSWSQDSRLVGGQTVKTGGTTALSTANSVVDTSKSFSVAGWYKIGTPGGQHVLASQEGTYGSAFRLTYYAPYSTWNFAMWSADAANATAANAYVLGSATQWTHVAGVYDAAAKELRLYVNGALAASTSYTGSWVSTGAFHIGRGKVTSALWYTDPGEAAEVQVFNRVLVPEDFSGKLASQASSGTFNEPGILTPISVGEWDFQTATACYEAGIPDTCETTDSTMWGRRLQFTPGSNVTAGYSGNGLQLDALHWAEEGDPHYGQTTQEYATAQRNTAASGQPAVWEDTPVLITDQSFTVSAWTYMPASAPGGGSVVSQLGTNSTAFYLGYDAYSGKWSMSIGEKPGTENTGSSTWASPVAVRDQWVHLVGSYNHSTKTIKIYVNGQLMSSAGVTNPWKGTGPLMLGLSNWRGFLSRLTGGIDEVAVFQGAMTDAAVRNLFDEQS